MLIKAALGNFLHAALLPYCRDAHEAALAAQTEWRTSGRCFWLNETAEPTPLPEMPAPDGERFYGFTHDAVQCAPELRGTLARALNHYIVRDLATITAHWGERTPSVPMVTLDGEYAHPRGWIRRRVTGSHRRGRREPAGA